MYSPIIIFRFKLKETFRDKSSLAFEHMTGLSATTNSLPDWELVLLTTIVAVFILAKEDKSDTVGKPMACIDMPGEIDWVMVEIGLVAVSCDGRNTQCHYPPGSRGDKVSPTHWVGSFW